MAINSKVLVNKALENMIERIETELPRFKGKLKINDSAPGYNGPELSIVYEWGVLGIKLCQLVLFTIEKKENYSEGIKYSVYGSRTINIKEIALEHMGILASKTRAKFLTLVDYQVATAI